MKIYIAQKIYKNTILLYSLKKPHQNTIIFTSTKTKSSIYKIMLYSSKKKKKIVKVIVCYIRQKY